MSVFLQFTCSITQQVKFTTQIVCYKRTSQTKITTVNINFIFSFSNSSQKGHLRSVHGLLGQQLDIIIFNISGTAIKLETCNTIQEEPAAFL